MASVAERADELTALARSRTVDDRERLMLGVADLCSEAEALDQPEVQRLLSDVFMTLVVEAEHDIRRRLAERIAGEAWAPAALVNVLALDEIEIARPVIARSPVLQDADLLRLLVETTLEHRIEVARRPGLAEAVCDAVVAHGEPVVLAALARNGSASPSAAAMERLVLASRRLADLRAPLARHPRLTRELSAMLYGWVGQTLRETIVQRFRVDAAEMDAAVALALRRAYDADAQAPAAPSAPTLNDERDAMDQRLIAKLHASGQLRLGYLVRALKDGRVALFEAGLATLLPAQLADVRLAIRSDQPELIALAAAAVGVDRSVFPTLLTELRRLTGGWPRTGVDSAAKVAAAFELPSPEAAREAFHNAIG
jgi:uncharacterized protein (DUF2336 family)